MTVPVWQPGTTYAPGALVVPRSSAPPTVATLQNPTFTDQTGWDLDAPLAIVTDTAGYAGGGRVGPTATTNGASGLNKAHISMAPGQSISAACMIQHGTGDKTSSDGAVQIAFFTATDQEILPRKQAGGLPSLSSDDWQRSVLTVAAPAGTAYARIGVGLYKHGADDIQAAYFSFNYTAQPPTRAAMYKATQAKPGKSGSTEPTWPPVGQSVQDNEVTWNGVNLDRLVWEASPLLTSGTTEPAWPDAIGGTVHDGTIDWIAYSPVIQDKNCPRSTVVAIMASKVFAADKDIVRFSATANALDWTTKLDAGYLPTGLQQANANDMAVLAPYRSNLTAFNASSFQNWQVDPDPSAMAPLDQMEGIGSIYQHAAQPVGNELFYLSQLGVRSVSFSAGSDNLQAGDIGIPIDSLVQSALADAGETVRPLAMYYPGAGQYWLAFPNYARPDDPTPVVATFLTSKPYPVLISDAMAVGALPLSGDAHVTYYEYPLSDAMTVGSVPLGGALRDQVQALSIASDAMTATAVPLGGTLKDGIQSLAAPAEAMAISATPQSGELRRGLVSYTYYTDAMAVGATPLSGVLS